jgi:pilus assembly protein Flp/PilA
MWLMNGHLKMPVLQTLEFYTDEEGATALEYGLLAALISAVIIVAATNLGISVIQAFVSINAAMMAIIGVGS